MIKGSIPSNEKERLEALRRYNILDTLPEEEYDDITTLASTICNTPISLVTLIDDDRQFFKSVHGIEGTETSRDVSLCAHAINTPNDLFVVSDARTDERFFDNPFVTGAPNVIFYAGMPLVTPDNFALGTLCVIDNKPHDLSDAQKDALRVLSHQVIKSMELKRKNEQLMESQEELETFAKEMESFAYTASHDLKEPLISLKALLSLLEDKYGDLLDADAKQYLFYAVDSATRMETLITDLLNYAKAVNSYEDVEETDIQQVVDEIVQHSQTTIKERGAIINSTHLPTIRISKTAIKQVFQNLIGNAMKYQADGVNPIVNIDAVEMDNFWQFKVVDNGIGIPEKYLTTVFDMFKRAHSNQGYRGTGLGLSICKKVVEKNGGNIWVESVEGKGSSFFFTIAKSK